MCEVVEISDDEESPSPDNDVIPKDEGFDFDLSPWNTCPRPAEDSVASSSRTSLRSTYIGMGFSPPLVDKAIEENGEGNPELLLETLFQYSDIQRPQMEGIDDGSFNGGTDGLYRSHVKEESDVGRGVADEKMATLLKMNFSVHEVGFAMDRLGKCASIGQIMDFIFAARMAKKYEKDGSDPFLEKEESKKDFSNEALFCIMDKTLRLLEMGFSENEISAAFEKCGSEAPMLELAEFIVSGGTSLAEKRLTSFNNHTVPTQYQSLKRKMGNHIPHPFDSFIVKTEGDSADDFSPMEIFDLHAKMKGQVPKEEYTNEPSNCKKPKEEVIEESCNSVCLMRPQTRRRKLTSVNNNVTPTRRQVSFLGNLEEDMKPATFVPNLGRSLTSVVAKPPYFFYGNITSLSHDSWIKITKYLYSVQPEFVNTKMYSSLSRNEGYVHNLPVENRFHVLPKGPMTIEEAVPHTRKCWPSWDTRKQLSYINCDTSGVSRACERLRRMVCECQGLPSIEQQKEILRQCEAKNLVWVGNAKLAPLEPEHVEHIMGYPVHHTCVSGIGLVERLESLKFSFQTDALGYHLSVLKPLFPGGLTMLSFFSGTGGAEVALHRLGIRLTGLVSVEPSERNRRILKQWWGKISGQGGGEFIQIDSIQKLSGNKLEDLLKRFGGFDIVVCKNPDSENDGHLDFSVFVEFVRVLQRVRATMGKNR